MAILEVIPELKKLMLPPLKVRNRQKKKKTKTESMTRNGSDKSYRMVQKEITELKGIEISFESMKYIAAHQGQ
jgi:hypothetical protein